jgi:hypothetical protein
MTSHYIQDLLFIGRACLVCGNPATIEKLKPATFYKQLNIFFGSIILFIPPLLEKVDLCIGKLAFRAPFERFHHICNNFAYPLIVVPFGSLCPAYIVMGVANKVKMDVFIILFVCSLWIRLRPVNFIDIIDVFLRTLYLILYLFLRRLIGFMIF